MRPIVDAHPRCWPLVSLFVLIVTAGLHAECQILEVRKIWDRAPHNAFTDLIRFNDEWLCVFREGASHVSPDGVLRVIVSKDGQTWSSAALLSSTNGDLRDAKITVTPSGELMLSGAIAFPRPSKVSHQSLAWFSRDGRSWSEPTTIGDTNFWLWRTTWHEGKGYSIGYATDSQKSVRLYRTEDGRHFQTLVPKLFQEGHPNETSIVFQPDGTALCLLRRDGQPSSGKLGRSKAPYTSWEWTDLGAKIGGPHLIHLPGNRLIGVVRLYDGKIRTSVVQIDPVTGRLTELIKLPSGGDTSYAGLAWHEQKLWISYYSSHEGKTSIYLAKVIP